MIYDLMQHIKVSILNTNWTNGKFNFLEFSAVRFIPMENESKSIIHFQFFSYFLLTSEKVHLSKEKIKFILFLYCWPARPRPNRRSLVSGVLTTSVSSGNQKTRYKVIWDLVGHWIRKSCYLLCLLISLANLRWPTRPQPTKFSLFIHGARCSEYFVLTLAL